VRYYYNVAKGGFSSSGGAAISSFSFGSPAYSRARQRGSHRGVSAQLRWKHGKVLGLGRGGAALRGWVRGRGWGVGPACHCRMRRGTPPAMRAGKGERRTRLEVEGRCGKRIAEEHERVLRDDSRAPGTWNGWRPALTRNRTFGITRWADPTACG
jgi:hypothetical protein